MVTQWCRCGPAEWHRACEPVPDEEVQLALDRLIPALRRSGVHPRELPRPVDGWRHYPRRREIAGGEQTSADQRLTSRELNALTPDIDDDGARGPRISPGAKCVALELLGFIVVPAHSKPNAEGCFDFLILNACIGGPPAALIRKAAKKLESQRRRDALVAL